MIFNDPSAIVNLRVAHFLAYLLESGIPEEDLQCAIAAARFRVENDPKNVGEYTDIAKSLAVRL